MKFIKQSVFFCHSRAGGNPGSSLFPFLFLSMFSLMSSTQGYATVSEAVKSETSKSETTEKQTPRVGIIDMQKVILSVAEGKTKRAELEEKIKKKEVQLAKQKSDVEKLNQELVTKSGVLSEEAKMKKQQELQDKAIGLRNDELSFRNEVKQEETQATQKIAMKVASMVDVIAKQENLDQVFEANSSGLLFAKNPIDLTERVIAEYSKQTTTISKK